MGKLMFPDFLSFLVQKSEREERVLINHLPNLALLCYAVVHGHAFTVFKNHPLRSDRIHSFIKAI